jgi:hypothetical protein
VEEFQYHNKEVLTRYCDSSCVKVNLLDNNLDSSNALRDNMKCVFVSTYTVFEYDVDPSNLICVSPDTILMIRLCVMSIIDMSFNFYNSSS